MPDNAKNANYPGCSAHKRRAHRLKIRKKIANAVAGYNADGSSKDMGGAASGGVTGIGLGAPPAAPSAMSALPISGLGQTNMMQGPPGLGATGAMGGNAATTAPISAGVS